MLLSNLVWFRMASAVPRYYVTKVSLDAPQTLFLMGVLVVIKSSIAVKSANIEKARVYTGSE